MVGWILYKEIYKELLGIFLYLLIVITGGRFLRWVCSGYLSGNGFRQLSLTIDPMETIVGVMVNGISRKHRAQYDEIMELYLESNNPENEEKLNKILDEYSQQLE